MSEPPRREQIALALAEKVGEKNRDQKKRAMDAQRRWQFSSLFPRPNSSAMDRLATMSPATRKLASSHLKIPGDSLLSSTPSSNLGRSLRTPELAATPKTPKRMMTPKRAATLKIDLGIKSAGDKEVSSMTC